MKDVVEATRVYLKELFGFDEGYGTTFTILEEGVIESSVSQDLSKHCTRRMFTPTYL